jgi:excisionase family DNA binding protein
MRGRLLTPEDAAIELAVSAKSIREWLKSGRLKGVKAGRLWRIRDYDLEEFLGEGALRKPKETSVQDPFLEVIGCLTGEPLIPAEIDRELYGGSSK